MIYHFTFRETQALLFQGDILKALNNLYYKVADKFHSAKRTGLMCISREKLAEKYLNDTSNVLFQNEANNLRIADYIRGVVHEIKIEQNMKIIQRELEKEYTLYKYSSLLNKITQSFSLKTNNSVILEYTVKQKMCKDYSRPFLKPKSYKNQYRSSNKEPGSATLPNNFDYKQIYYKED